MCCPSICSAPLTTLLNLFRFFILTSAALVMMDDRQLLLLC
jgi:hypothetical protein